MVAVVSLTADRLAEAMSLRSTDQSELARDIGVTQGAISKIVLGKTANSRLLPRIASHLGVPLPWLLGLSDDIDGEGSETVSGAERDWIDQLRLLDATDRSAVLQLTKSLAQATRAARTLHAPTREYRAE